MPRRIGLSAILALAFGLCLAYNACSVSDPKSFITTDGTSTAGNPMAPTTNGIISALCGVIQRCHSQASYSKCTTDILSVSGITNKLGLSSTYSELNRALRAEQGGLIEGNPVATDSCYSEIDTLNCQSTEVRDAFDSQASNPFSGSSSLIPTQGGACSQVYTPTGWSVMNGTKLATACPTDPAIQGTVGCKAVISSWSGAVADTKLNRMIIWGGGATNYFGNEVYALNLGSQSMTRLTNPSPRADCTNVTSDGKPSARSTFNGLSYIQHTHQLFSVGGSLSCASGGSRAQDTWTLDLNSLLWTSRDPHSGGVTPATGFPNLGEGIFSDYDPVTKLVYVHDRAQFFSYDPDSNTYTLLSTMANGVPPLTGVIDTKRRLFVGIGDGHVKAISIAAGSNFQMQNWDSEVTGCDGLRNAYLPGIAYSPSLDRIVGWAGGSSVYIFDPDTKSCVLRIFTDGPGAQQVNGTNGRFRYFPDLDVFALVNDWQQDAFLLRLSP